MFDFRFVVCFWDGGTTVGLVLADFPLVHEELFFRAPGTLGQHTHISQLELLDNHKKLNIYIILYLYKESPSVQAAHLVATFLVVAQ